ncbi:MAG: DUF4358 domain-containing protein [Acetatifactor sp.]
MKKLSLFLCTGLMMVSLAGCGKNGNQESSEAQQSTPQSSQQESTTQNNQQDGGENNNQNQSEETGTVANGYDYADGWTEEMEGILTAVKEYLGEDYRPNMPMMPDQFAEVYGITEDMYEDYLAEVPMISAHVDQMIIVKPKAGQEEAVEKALNAYRDMQVNNTLQYPSNVGRVQASRVERAGDYVCFLLLGRDTTSIEQEYGNGEKDPTEAIISSCQEVNDKVLEIIGGQAK